MNTVTKVSKIFNKVLSEGINTSKGDIMSDDPIEDKVYTKRININKDYEFENNVDIVEVVSVSVTSYNENMKDATPRKLRINMKNRAGSWVNIFINEAPKELIEFIYENI